MAPLPLHTPMYAVCVDIELEPHASCRWHHREMLYLRVLIPLRVIFRRGRSCYGRPRMNEVSH